MVKILGDSDSSERRKLPKVIIRGCRRLSPMVEDKFNFLENRIRKHATALVASGLFEEPIDPTVASQVGMICCEEEGHLKEKPVLLQSR
ncbi:unnamed protein product [Camellia sinensis]